MLVRVFPHDTSSYTQGLAYRDRFLYEGTGRNGQSVLRKVRPETGEIVQQVKLDSEFFGEGITLVKDQILQLTWTSGVGFVYDLKTSICCAGSLTQEKAGDWRQMAKTFS